MLQTRLKPETHTLDPPLGSSLGKKPGTGPTPTPEGGQGDMGSAGREMADVGARASVQCEIPGDTRTGKAQSIHLPGSRRTSGKDWPSSPSYQAASAQRGWAKVTAPPSGRL